MTELTPENCPSFKISVNSHVNYGLALQTLLHSLDCVGFPRKDVIVTICGRSGHPIELIEISPDREVIIYVPKNCYDLSHAFGIHSYIDHPRVKADCYIGIHDTCVAVNEFPLRMREYAQALMRYNFDVLYALETKQLGLAGFSYHFMKEHGHNYDREIDKPMAWAAEHGHELSYLSFVPPEKVGHFKCPFHYETGQPLYSDLIRHPIHIGSMGIVKYVCNDDADKNPPWQQRVRP